jgi:hypothetical protein
VQSGWNGSRYFDSSKGFIGGERFEICFLPAGKYDLVFSGHLGGVYEAPLEVIVGSINQIIDIQ